MGLLLLQLSGKSLRTRLSSTNTWSQVSLSHLSSSILSKEAWSLLWLQDFSLTNLVGFGRKADPDPGRCRRTDGKKWRCSKEAHPDSKYCERHMHRGRNRSRKHVELASTTTSTAATTAVTTPSPSIYRNLSTTTSPSASSYSFSPLSSVMEPEFHVHQNPSQSTILNPFHYPHSSSSRPPGSGFSTQNSTTHNLFLGSGSSHTDKDCRYLHGMREGLDERAFFPEDSGSVRTLQDTYQQQAMSSYKGYSQSQFESLADSSKKQEEQQQHCFVLGTDFKSSSTRSIKLEKESETQKSLHHFFGDWQPKNSDSWLDLASSSRLHTADS
ncbi:growth-regulating factor 5-like isoform X2 [Hevea brasiliensis]|uniref:growth-regulating factor 5-like isoform X2 n=1 Tax=Hevea brasiliensis TaxID=3981 RepID=UPI0025D83D14|nr:growth-regulating factor 5-like isoform X2 [Hevea brasiliensis]